MSVASNVSCRGGAPREPGAPGRSAALRGSRALLVAGALMLGLAGCASVDATRPESLRPLPPPLPALRADLDLVSERYAAPLLDDMRTVLVEQADGLLWTSVDDPSGPRAEWSLVRLQSRDSYAWLVLSVLTAGVANLFGAPAASHDATFQLELKLLGQDGATLGSWQIGGQATGWWAAWWGQDDDGARRQARLDALHAALDDARAQLADPEHGLAAALAGAQTSGGTPSP